MFEKQYPQITWTEIEVSAHSMENIRNKGINVIADLWFYHVLSLVTFGLLHMWMLTTPETYILCKELLSGSQRSKFETKIQSHQNAAALPFPQIPCDILVSACCLYLPLSGRAFQSFQGTLYGGHISTSAVRNLSLSIISGNLCCGSHA